MYKKLVKTTLNQLKNYPKYICMLMYRIYKSMR